MLTPVLLAVCNTPKKCVFVRVVDTCAGCAAGSKHVDLTRAAFGQLASFDQGTLTVQLRLATEPSGWYALHALWYRKETLTLYIRYEDLWGPKHD